MGHGALAFMIPTIGQEAQLRRGAVSIAEVVRVMDGLVLQGGADVSPLSYGEQPLRPEWSGDRVRDLYEIELVWEFLIQGKPVLGICRGAQLINVARGGTLFQDITEQYPDAGQHRDPELYDGFNHDIEIVPGSHLASLYLGRSVCRVNSIHHQAIDKLGKDLAIEARACEDGVVEAIRWLGNGYMCGCQWHPEFQAGYPELLDGGPIISDFLAAAKLARA